MRAKGEDEQEEIFSTYDEFKQKVDRTVTTTTHKFVRPWARRSNQTITAQKK